MPKNKENGLNMDILPALVGYHLRMAQLCAYRDFSSRIGRATRTTPAQLAMLLLVEVNPGISQTKLGSAMSMDRASTMAVIDKLEKRNWLCRNKSTEDRRKHALQVLPKGRAILRKLRPGMMRHEASITARLDEREKQMLIDLLKRIQK